MKKTLIVSLVVALAASSVVAGARRSPDPAGRYVVALDRETAKSGDWKKVADALAAKYSGKVVRYDASSVEGILPELRKLKPRYVCFVTAPERAGRAFVVAAAQALRKIDDDPYGDAIWGIVTGYEPRDAMRLVNGWDSITVNSIATSMGGTKTLDSWKSGFASDEGNAGRMWTKKAGGETEELKVSPDPAEELAKAFNTIPIDYWVTSGHASERDWQIIYNKPKGSFVHSAGTLVAVSSERKRFKIECPNPKVYIAAGNCLIGDVDRKDCMATAWMRSGGVVQMAGYTVPSFYGYMGWGVKGLFESGRHTAAESHFFSNQTLLWALGRRNAKLRDIPVDASGSFSPNTFAKRLQGKLRNFDDLGLVWDRDTFAFLGDPAGKAAMPDDRRDIEVVAKGDRIGVRFLRDVKLSENRDDARGFRPVGVFLDEPPPDGAALVDKDGKPVADAVLTDFFALLPLEGAHAKGETLLFTIKRPKSPSAAVR